MPQTFILNKLAAFLRFKAQTNPNISPRLINHLANGHCHGFTLCYGVMNWLDRFYDKERCRNMVRWLTMLKYIKDWENGDPDEIICELPRLPTHQSDQKDSKQTESQTELVTLTSIFETVINFIVDNQADNYITGLTSQDTRQSQFLDPQIIPEDQKLSKAQTETRWFQLAVADKSPDPDLPQPPAKMFTIQARFQAGGFDQKNEEHQKTLIECLEHPDTQHLLANGICLVKCGIHVCLLEFDPESGLWAFYDSNYENEAPKLFSSPAKLIEEMYQQSFNMEIGFDLIHLTPPPAGMVFFKPFWDRLQDPEQVHSMLDNDGLINLVQFAPKALPLVLKHPSINKTTYLNQKNKMGYTALMVAANFGYLDAVQLLLENGAYLAPKNYSGNTALHLAIKSQHPDPKIVALLLNAWPRNANAKDSDGSTPLHHAAQLNNLEFVKLLLESKADASIKNKAGLNALHSSILEKNIETTILLLQNQPRIINDKDVNQNTPLHYAAIQGRLELAKFLLENKADPRSKNNMGQLPLHQSVIANNIQMTKLLLQIDPSLVNEKDQFGYTPLQLAVLSYSMELVILLLEFNADPRIKNANEQLPLHLSIIAKDIQMTKLLLQAQPSLVNEKDKFGFTPLQTAIYNGPVELVALLCEFKADGSIRDSFGRTAWDLALVSADPKIKDLFSFLKDAPLTQYRFGISYQLGRRDFSNLNFGSLDLSKYDLSDANLSATDLRNVRLEGANIKSAEISQVKLGRDQFEQFCRAGKTDFTEVDLRGVDLRGLDLSLNYFKNANFIGVHFSVDSLPSVDYFTNGFLEATIYDEKTAQPVQNAIKAIVGYLKNPDNATNNGNVRAKALLIELIHTQQIGPIMNHFLKSGKVPEIDHEEARSSFFKQSKPDMELINILNDIIKPELSSVSLCPSVLMFAY